MPRIPKELRLYVQDRYAPCPKGRRPKEVRINDGTAWGRFDRNRLAAHEAWSEAGSPDYEDLPYSAWVTVSVSGLAVPSALGISNWYHAALGQIHGRCISFGGQVRGDSAYQGIEIILTRENI